MSGDHRLALLGRTSERELLDAMLASARSGRSAVLVIHGEPGIGKTAMLRYAARQASGLRIAQIAGVQAEMELPFAGIHQLCAPMFDRLDGLPEPQRNALNVALGVSPGETPNRFLVALAVLSLLCAAAEERPLLCLVDDAQWLDAASGEVLGFVARRLLAESVAIVFGVREPIAGHALDGLPDLSLGGLQEADARSLLSRALPGRLDDRVRDRIIAETGGNPLALLELAQNMRGAERAGAYVQPAAGDLPGQVEEQYVRRVRGLPAAAQRLILLAAADPVGDATLVWRAAERLSIDATALTPAAAAGLLEIDDRVRFRHPLVRSAVYRAASVDDRRRVHEALAEVSDPDLDAERRAWHLATAASGPDEEIAFELERCAGRAQARGGLAAAAAFLQRAAALSQDPGRAAERALAAAQASFQAGAFDTALGLVATAEAYALDGYQAARAELLRAHVAYASSWGNDAAPLLLQAARRLEPFDLDLARRAYLTAWGAAVAAGHLGEGDGGFLEICHAIRALPPPAGAPHPLDLLLDGFALLTTDGRAAATPMLQRAAKAIAGMPTEDVLRWGTLGSGPSAAIWDSDGFSAILERQAQIVRDAGALAELPIHLSALAMDKAWIGDFAGAAILLAESDSVAGVIGSPPQTFAEIGLRALQGREAEVFELIERAIRQGGGEAVATAHWAAAVLYNGLARYDEAVSAARQVITNAIGPWNTVWVLPELVEAAARVGDAELARDALKRLAESTQPAGTHLALGIEARSRALVSGGTAAEDLYREAIDRLSKTRRRPELARTHLLLGEWLRHEDRGVDAREQLRTAHEMLAAIGMEAFAERARRELLAAGGNVRKRSVEPRGALTPQEEQIARLARDGLTNSQIGSHLFLSPRTVEWHLRKVFAKLGITSRSGLVTALPASEPDAARE
jgi:DNA-binding CsgD family transcriptional regulator/tetratricopeptide (TPR) repeat protein